MQAIRVDIEDKKRKKNKKTVFFYWNGYIETLKCLLKQQETSLKLTIILYPREIGQIYYDDYTENTKTTSSFLPLDTQPILISATRYHNERYNYTLKTKEEAETGIKEEKKKKRKNDKAKLQHDEETPSVPIMRRKKGERAPGVSGNRQLAAAWSMSGTCLTLTIAAGFSRLIRPVLVYAENKDKPRPRAERLVQQFH